MRKFSVLIALLMLLLAGESSAQPGHEVPLHYASKRYSATGYFATVSTLSIYEDLSNPETVEKISQTWQEVKDILARVEQRVSVMIPGSDIAQYNALKYKEAVAVSEETVTLVELARTMHQKTEGYYDPTVFPLVDLWGFSPRFTYSREKVMPYDRDAEGGFLPLPDTRYIEALKKLVWMDGVQVEGNAREGYYLRKMTPPVTVDGVVYQAQIDLGGIAKGYVTDLVSELLQKKGFHYGYFSSGTSSMRLMKSASFSAKQAQDNRYHLEIRKPRETSVSNGAYATVAVRDEALSSSGDYDNNYMIDGAIYSHLINPFTGYPVNTPSGDVQQGISTVTLLSGSAAEDDAYTTALCLMGPEKALKYFNAHLKDRQIVMVYFRHDQQQYEVVSNISLDQLIIDDPAYLLASRINHDGSIEYTGKLFQ